MDKLSDKKILFISYYYHPSTLTATRNYYLSRALAASGYEVHVLGRISESIRANLHANIRVHPIDAWDYRKVLIALGVKDGVSSTVIAPGKWIQWGYKLLLKYPFNKWLGEGGGFYYLKAVKQGLRIIKRHQISHIYSSYRPMTDHFIAQKIKTNSKEVKWIADFRDVLWWSRSNPNYQKKWIRSMIRDMDAITSVTEGVGNFWSAIYKRNVITNYNGLPNVIAPPTDDLKDTTHFRINYTGSLYNGLQSAIVFFLAIQEIIQENDLFKNKLLIQYSGLNAELWTNWIEEYNLMAFSDIKNQISIEEAWKNQSISQINLLLTWAEPDLTGIIHGKFNEYVSVGNPILCIIRGEKDPELEKIYSRLTNSYLTYNSEKNKNSVKEFILSHFNYWLENKSVNKIHENVKSSFSWDKAKDILIPIIENSPSN